MIKVNMNTKDESVFYDLLINTMDDNTSIMSLKVPPHPFSYNNENPVFNIIWKLEDESEIFKIICITNFIREHAPKKHYLFLDMNYIPYINRRIINNINNMNVNSFKYFVNIINSLNFDNVKIFDPYDYKLANMINNVEIYDNKLAVGAAIEDCAPDYICFERYNDIFKTPDDVIPTSTLYLQNNAFTNEVEICSYMDNEKNFKNKKILLIMNYVSIYNHSIYDIYNKFVELGFSEIYIYVSHLSNSIIESEILNPSPINEKLKMIYTTDSLYKEDISLKKITVIN